MRAQLTAAVTAMALCAVAPQLAAQDSSATQRIRPDTAGYTSGAGVDTTGAPGQVSPANPSTGGALDTLSTGAGDTTGMNGRHPDSTRVGDSTSPSGSSSTGVYPAPSPSGSVSTDSAGVANPTKQPGQSSSRTGADSTSP
jgi:hypothetical protein